MAIYISKWFLALVCGRGADRYHFHFNITTILMILAWMISILLIGGLVCWLVAQWNTALVKWIALVATVIDLVLVLNIWIQERTVNSANTWFINYQAPWIPSFGISF